MAFAIDMRLGVLGLEIVMGVGNYYLTGAKTVYIEHEAIYGDEPDGVFDAAFLVDESLIPLIADSLPKSFCTLPRTDRYWADRERKVIAESGLFRVSLVDWHGYFAVNVEVIDEQLATPLARHMLEKTASRIFDALNEVFALRVRNTGWTSSLYSNTRQALAA